MTWDGTDKPSSRHNLVHHPAKIIRQPLVPPVMEEGELAVVEAEQAGIQGDRRFVLVPNSPFGAIRSEPPFVYETDTQNGVSQ